MTAIADTYRLVNRWKEAGLSEEQAGKMVTALNEELEQGLATKSDIAELKAAIKTDFAEFKTDIARWAIGCSIAVVGFTVGLVKLI